MRVFGCHALLVGILVNVALLLLWGMLLYFLKDSLMVIYSGVAVGILGVFVLSGLIQYWLWISGIPFTEQQSKTLVAPIVEESTKFLFIFLTAWRIRRISSQVVVFGVSVGLGFAFIENFLFVANVPNLLQRGVSSWILHMGTALILSKGIRSRLLLERSMIWAVFGLLAAVVIHGVFNLMVLSLGFG